MRTFKGAEPNEPSGPRVPDGSCSSRSKMTVRWARMFWSKRSSSALIVFGWSASFSAGDFTVGSLPKACQSGIFDQSGPAGLLG